MQRKQFFFVCFLLALLTGVVACHKPIHAEPPVYASIKFNPDEPTRYGRAEPGDSVTVFVEVAYPGDYITEAEYFWSLTASGYDGQSAVVKIVAPHKQTTPPTWGFRAPSSGTYTVTFKAKYDYSAQTVNGTIFGQSNTLSAELKVR